MILLCQHSAACLSSLILNCKSYHFAWCNRILFWVSKFMVLVYFVSIEVENCSSMIIRRIFCLNWRGLLNVWKLFSLHNHLVIATNEVRLIQPALLSDAIIHDMAYISTADRLPAFLNQMKSSMKWRLLDCALTSWEKCRPVWCSKVACLIQLVMLIWFIYVLLL